jgi:threonine dehydratase
MVSILSEILRAEQRIRPCVRETPLDLSLVLSEIGGAQVYVKSENLQHTGSFKLRGAFNKLLSLTPAERAAGVITASSGNHGAATAYALRTLGATGTVFVPTTVAPLKEAMIRRYGAQIHKVGHDSGISEIEARRTADERGLLYISPYNDPQIIGGQGTIGVEIARQLAQVDAVFVALGGGGLISGIATYLKAVNPAVQIIACSPSNSAVMQHSVATGQIIEEESLPTLSDGTAGGVEPGAITFPLVRDLVDRYVDVSEAEIGAALRLFLETHHQLIEGAAGVAIAAYLQAKEAFAGKNVVIILCGANIGLETLKSVI